MAERWQGRRVGLDHVILQGMPRLSEGAEGIHQGIWVRQEEVQEMPQGTRLDSANKEWMLPPEHQGVAGHLGSQSQ